VIPLVLALMAADLVTFALAVPSVGIAAEANPVMAAAYAFGLWPVAALKAACAAAIVLLCLRVHDVPRRRLAAVTGAGIAAVGVVGNVTSWWAA
jgi:hypothetical protein